MALLLLVGSLLVAGVTALNNGVGKLPKLGFNSQSPPPERTGNSVDLDLTAWNVYQCNYDADVLLAQARAMVGHGLVEAGYDVRECWTQDSVCYH
jgi:alpha-galactosidase